MINRINLAVLISVLIAAAACGDVHDVGDDDSVQYRGADGEFYDINPVTTLVVDDNRDGVVDPEDHQDLAQRHDPDPGHGALFLANVDDDARACEGAGDDDALASCFDAATPGIDGVNDLADLARLKTAPTGAVGPEVYATLTLSEGGQDRVNLFINTGDETEGVEGFIPFAPGEDRVDGAALEEGVEFAIEGRSLVDESWDGHLELQWEIHIPVLERTRTDRVHMALAPVIFPNHMLPASHIYATDLGEQNEEFVQGLQSATDAAAIAQGLSLFDTGDPWIQDYLLTGYMAMPGPAGPQVMDISFRSANINYPESLEAVFERIYEMEGNAMPPLLRQAGRLVYDEFHGADQAGLTVYDGDKGFDGVDISGFDVDDVVAYLYGMQSDREYPEIAQLVSQVFEADTMDSFGNTETTPPHVASNGRAYPQGRVYRGRSSDPAVRPDPSLSAMIDAQANQPIIWLDTGWLLVRHVDETLAFVQTDTERGWSLLYNDPARARDLLEEARDERGAADALLFEDRYYSPDYDQCEWTSNGWDCPPPPPATRRVDQVLNDEDVMAASARAAVEIDAQVVVMQEALALDDQDLIPIAFLHEDSGQGSLAYQPGIINGISLTPDRFGAPDPHGPNIDGEDIFIADVEGLLEPKGVHLHWIETWDPYHIGVGQVHCGSNTRRELPQQPWWTEESQ